MSDHKNQPNMTPSGPVGHSILSRSNIMGTGTGKYPWTMFMPGQSSGREDEYPTEWPDAGRLIRVPKCVFLTSNPPAHLWGKNFTLMSKWGPFGYLGHWDDAVPRDTRTSEAVVFPYGTLLFGGFVGTYTYIGWTIDPQYSGENDGRRKWNKCCVVPNPIYTEHLRLVGEFKKAKDILESRYPQDVYVEICEFFPSEPKTVVAPNDELMPLVFDVYTPEGLDANQPKHGANGPSWLLGPDKAVDGTTPFFGSNFFHIYCGYQDDGSDSQPRTAEDTLSRWHFYNRSMGYKLDRNFGPGFDQWVESSAIPSGYEGVSYDIATSHMDAALGKNDPGQSLTDPSGKLDYLRIGFQNFAGYRVALHEYDLAFSFPPAEFLGPSATRMPPHFVSHGDQDWVEQTVVLGYNQRKAIYEASPAFQYGDGYFPGPEGLNGDGAYNEFVKYPGTDSYVNDFIPALQAQRTQLMDACNGLGPKTVSIWQHLIDKHDLGDVGVKYEGGSSKLTADSIVRLVEENYGLNP